MANGAARWTYGMRRLPGTGEALPLFFELVATICAGPFAGAAIYITFVEHPARLECGTALAATRGRGWASGAARWSPAGAGDSVHPGRDPPDQQAVARSFTGPDLVGGGRVAGEVGPAARGPKRCQRPRLRVAGLAPGATRLTAGRAYECMRLQAGKACGLPPRRMPAPRLAFMSPRVEVVCSSAPVAW